MIIINVECIVKVNIHYKVIHLAGALIGPIAFAIMVVGNSAVIIGLWTAHVFWTYYCVARLYFLSKFFGLAIANYVWLYVSYVLTQSHSSIVGLWQQNKEVWTGFQDCGVDMFAGSFVTFAGSWYCW